MHSCLYGPWRRDAPMRTATAPSTPTCAVLVRQLMTDTEASQPTERAATPTLYRHGPAQADDGQIALSPTRPACISSIGDHHHATARSGTNYHFKEPHLRAHNGASDTTSIAPLARGSVQSGFNEVAVQVLGAVCVARPHRSLQNLVRPIARFRRPLRELAAGGQSQSSTSRT